MLLFFEKYGIMTAKRPLYLRIPVSARGRRKPGARWNVMSGGHDIINTNVPAVSGAGGPGRQNAGGDRENVLIRNTKAGG